ncbi:MAG: potassium channel family protein [Desulfobaccales bacterium]
MKLSRLHPDHFWSNESGMTSLLIFSVAYLFVVCALSELSFGDLVADLMFSLIIVAGVLTVFKQRWVRFLVIGLAVATLALTWHQEIRPIESLAILNTVLKLIFLGFLFAVLIIQVFGAGAVTAHRIRGAIVVYLLLGGMWSLLYHLVALTIPNSFHLPEGLDPSNPAALGRVLTYFSYTTLTTTGFGDITPIRPLARTLAMFEALAGQLYLVITLARLVAQAIMAQKEKRQNNPRD